MTYEGGNTTLYAFLQCLEDIAIYIDNFTCSNEIVSLDDTSFDDIHVPKTSFQVLEPSRAVNTTKRFEISRRRKDNMRSSSAQVILNVEEKKGGEYIVKTCSLIQEGNALSERGELRDAVCAHLAASLGVFPILSFLLPLQNHIQSIPTPLGMGADPPRFCFKITGVDQQCIMICLNSSDQVLTLKQDVLDTWDLHGDKNDKTLKNISDANLLLFLTFVLGNTVINIPSTNMNAIKI